MEKREQKTMQHCVFFPSVPQEQKRAKETEIGQLCSVAIQVLFGLRFGFSKGVVYFHIVLKFRVAYNFS